MLVVHVVKRVIQQFGKRLDGAEGESRFRCHFSKEALGARKEIKPIFRSQSAGRGFVTITLGFRFRLAILQLHLKKASPSCAKLCAREFKECFNDGFPQVLNHSGRVCQVQAPIRDLLETGFIRANVLNVWRMVYNSSTFQNAAGNIARINGLHMVGDPAGQKARPATDVQHAIIGL